MPDADGWPAELRGRRLAMIDGAVLGDDAVAAEVLAPLRALAPEFDSVTRVPASSLVRLHLDPEGPTPAYASSTLISGLPDAAIAAVVDAAGPRSGTRLAVAELRQLGGALARPDPAGGALDSLDGAFLALGLGLGEDADDVRADAARFLAAVEPWATGRQYLPMLDDRTDTRKVFPPGVHARLSSIRARRRPGPAVRRAPRRRLRVALKPGATGRNRPSRHPGPPFRQTSSPTSPELEGTVSLTTHTAVVETEAPEVSFEPLQARLTGSVHTPGDPRYDALVSPWNLAVTVAPAAVVDARTADDVAAAVRFAGAHGLTAGVQATGHGAIPGIHGHLLIVTKGLDELAVHPEGWARVGAGVKWLPVIEAAAPYGLAALNGSSSDVGIVGYTTGGGVGPMARTFGLAADRVRAFDVVTGDGVQRRVTPTEHPDLFFALRGGKGTAGIVTAVEFDLIHLPDVLRRGDLLRRHRRRAGHRPVAHLVGRAAGAGDDVVRAVPAAPAAGDPAAAGRPDDDRGPVPVDR